MEIFGEALSPGGVAFLLVALGLALSFEFVNGFHDTANAVATVIYTHTLRPTVAVVWSGCWNLLGVLTSSGAVAFGIVALLPAELVVNIGSGAGFAMVFGILISAIIWNLGTWYLALPASSSHTLIGSIIGVGLASSVLSGGQAFGDGVNWAKVSEVGVSLLVSPLVGFIGAAGLLLLTRALIKRKELYTPPEKDTPPPLWIRGLLVLTCTGVSFGHGSNDGQKGMGLIMLILIGILPATYAVDLHTGAASIQELANGARSVSSRMERRAQGVAIADPEIAARELSAYLKTRGVAGASTFAALAFKSRRISESLSGKSKLTDLTAERRGFLRTDLYLVSETLGKLVRTKKLGDHAERSEADALRAKMDKVTRFIPDWVKVAVALALGIGTMIGWKRIVVTVGEKIGKERLTYSQGASAEIVAALTILAADKYGLPVSTTHVLSSGIAGTMAASRSGLQVNTLRNLLLAWVLTLPVCVLLGAGIFAFGLNVALRLGIR